MSFPKIQYPLYKITIPSLKKEITARPFLVKEEKILLHAKSSGERIDILLAIKQIVNNCIIMPENFDVNTLSLFDLEYIYLKMRAQSVSNIVNVVYTDLEDSKNYNFEIDLNTIQVVFPENVTNIIVIADDYGIYMKYPSVSLYEDKEFIESNDQDSFFRLIARCVDKIYDGDSVYKANSDNIKDIEEYIENLDIKTFEKIKVFMIDQPSIRHTIKYTNSLGNERIVELNTLEDFFTFR